MVTDTIDGISIDTDEDGFYVILSGEKAEYRFNIHGVADQFLKQAWREIGPWWNEGEDARRTRVVSEEEEAFGQYLGYDIRDPKHPAHRDIFGDLA